MNIGCPNRCSPVSDWKGGVLNCDCTSFAKHAILVARKPLPLFLAQRIACCRVKWAGNFRRRPRGKRLLPGSDHPGLGGERTPTIASVFVFYQAIELDASRALPAKPSYPDRQETDQADADKQKRRGLRRLDDIPSRVRAGITNSYCYRAV